MKVPLITTSQPADIYFMHHRELLGGLARAAWDTAQELMTAAVAEPELQAGMVAASTAKVRVLRRRWRELIKRIYEVDPLLCPWCLSECICGSSA